MKQKINLRLGLIALVALILTTVGVTKVYYDLFRQQVGRDLRLTAHLLGQSGEFTRGNAPKLQDPEVNRKQPCFLRQRRQCRSITAKENGTIWLLSRSLLWYSFFFF